MPGTSRDAGHRAYFQAQQSSTREFWQRFGARPELAGARVIDLGCGHGAMSVDMATSGATVLGLDLDGERIAFARRNVAERFPELRERIDFETVDVVTSGFVNEFDYIVTKDTLEHVQDLSEMLAALKQALRPAGQIWAGFSPLYFSPRGDHGRVGLRLPWLHAVLPSRVVLTAASRHRRVPVESLSDLGLNGLTPDAFRRAVHRNGLRFVSLRYNAGDKARLRALGALRRVAPLEKFVTVGIYCVLAR